jgi:putative transposase
MHRMKYPVEKMCRAFKVSRSGYYNWLHAKPSVRWNATEALTKDIKTAFELSHETYGSPRIKVEMDLLGYTASRQLIARLMRANGLSARRPKRFVATTDSKHKYPIAPNILNRHFDVDRSNKVWVSDITYVRTLQGWMYLTVIIDLFERKVIGWSMSENLSTEATIIPAWRMAEKNRPITKTLIFHSDRGVQYACTDFTNILKSYGGLVIRSMSRKGDCWDNAVAESFFKTLKTELVYKHKYANRNQAQLSIFQWIETWYNRKRRHSALGYKTIEEFELLFNFESMAA